MARPASAGPFVNNLSQNRHNDSKSKYTVIEFNLNGWFSNRNPYYLEFDKNILNYLDSDFLILPETHASSDQKLEMPNYTFFQNNRQKMSNF